jgi:5-methyltetrahydropteroyltriglutamate--homocysteine methyltransferase
MPRQRILTSHVGSLVRPPAFTDVLRRRHQGEEIADFPEILTRAVEEAVRRQVEVGIDIVSDGEFGKGIGWDQYVIERLSGFELPKDGAVSLGSFSFGDLRNFPGFYREHWSNEGYLEQPFVCTGPISYTGRAALARDIRNLQSGLAKSGGDAAGFLPVVAPASALALTSNQHYGSDEEFVFAAADALRVEYRTILDAGLYLQIDDAHLAFAHDCMVPPKSMRDFRTWAQLRIDALNHALNGLPTERIRYHLCWGSWNGPHASDVPLKELVDLLLQLNVGGYAIEAANARHEHEWKVWKEVKLPAGSKLMPGVISHQTNVVEHPELVAERLLRFASVVGGENMIAGTDCGFAQGPFVKRVHEEIMWAKLASLVEGARLATRELWGAAATA